MFKVLAEFKRQFPEVAVYTLKKGHVVSIWTKETCKVLAFDGGK